MLMRHCHLNFQCVLNDCNINGMSTIPYLNHHDHLNTFRTNKLPKADVCSNVVRTPRKPPRQVWRHIAIDVINTLEECKT